MKILIFIPTLRAGGAERVASILANNWVETGAEITICLLYNDNVFFKISEKVKIVSLTDSFEKVNKISIIFQLRKLLKRNKPDVIQSFLTEYNILCLISMIGIKTPIYVSDRANPLVYRGLLIELLRKLLYVKSKGIIAQTKLAKKELFKKIGHSNIQVIPNPVKIPSSLKLDRQKIILSVGRLIPEKNQEDLITAFNKAEISKEWKLQIVGDGPLMNKLMDKVKTEDVKNVEFVGQSDAVYKYYENASVFLFTSKSEGYPNAVAEAMAFELPVVSYNCNAGPSDLIDNSKSGFLIKVDDIDSLITHIELLANDESLRYKIGKEAGKSIISNNEENISNVWLKFITNKK